MPTTNIEGPNANIAAGTIDGVTYGALGQPQRIHESVTGASAAFGTTALKGSLYDNCFNLTQIPSSFTTDNPVNSNTIGCNHYWHRTSSRSRF